MLEHMPEWLGRAMAGWRAGADKLAVVQPALGPFAALRLWSPAFADGARLPERFTADGEGVSPPLAWADVPDGTVSLALLVEDADAPTPQPLVHAVVWDLPPDGAAMLEEGTIGTPDVATGRNSYGRTDWLPPDPPTGHGTHHYVFQLFALGDAGSAAMPAPDESPGRSALVEAMADRVLAAGVLTGTYDRAEPAAVGPGGATVAGAAPA